MTIQLFLTTGLGEDEEVVATWVSPHVPEIEDRVEIGSKTYMVGSRVWFLPAGSTFIPAVKVRLR